MYDLPKGFKVDCVTREQFGEALALLENAGYVWTDGTSLSVTAPSDGIYIYTEDKRVTYGIYWSTFAHDKRTQIPFSYLVTTLTSDRFSDTDFLGMLGGGSSA